VLIGYARVSTDDQNLDLQRDALIKAGVDPNRIFEDKLSGVRADRPGLDAAFKAVREGDVLVIWRLDRLGRSMRDLIDRADDLKQRGVRLRSLTEGIDATSIGGEMVFHILAALAQFERNLIRERTRAGLASARARGRVGGRPPGLKPKDIAAAKAMLSDPNITMAEVAETLGVSVSTLHRHLPGGRSAIEVKIAMAAE
jgi:DNA invertase Pin-like site-specific DNA recombinase